MDSAPSPLWLRRELLAQGWSDSGIATSVRRGELHRVRHGAYTNGSAWRDLDEHGRHLLAVRAVVRQSGTDVVVSHSSAAIHHGAPTWGLPIDWVHITRRDSRTGRGEAYVRQHRGRILDGDVEQHGELAVMSATRAALEVTTIASSEAALVVVNHLVRAGATSTDKLRQRYESGIDRWSSTLTTDVVLRRAEPLCESVGESRFWHLCHVARLPVPVPQYVVRDEAGAIVARLDFAWPDLGVFVEFDGLVKYRLPTDPRVSATEVVIAEKRREDLVRELTGWICIRVTWSDLQDPARLEARLRRALSQRRTAVS